LEELTIKELEEALHKQQQGIIKMISETTDGLEEFVFIVGKIPEEKK
jgi:hypothetical protein